MEQVQAFTDSLFQAIMERQQYFDLFLLPKLQEEYKIAQSAAKTIRTVLIKKGILRDDPYKYDSKIGDIEIPSEENFADGERAIIIGSRLAQYEAMLDFINNYFIFNCDFLNTEKINKLAALNRVFTWESFSHTSTKPNTRGLAELINGVRTGADSLSMSIISDAITQLSRNSIAVTKTLKGLAEFHRERYKVAVRKLVLPGAMFQGESVMTGGMTSAIKEIKRSFAVNMKDQPFYTELIEEILKEDYSADHAVLQQELLTRLTVTKQDAAHNAAADSLKPTLMDGMRTLGAISPQIDSICVKLAENHHTIMNLEKTFFEKLAEIFRKAFNIKEKQEDIVITTVDPVTQTGKRESINLAALLEDLRRRSRIYTGFAVKTSPAYMKIEGMDEPQILDLLTRHIAETNVILKQCAGLDEYFKGSIPAEHRERIRGVKVEISAIRNSLVKANQCRAEYASQLEEQQQLKKLGILNA